MHALATIANLNRQAAAKIARDAAKLAAETEAAKKANEDRAKRNS